MELAPSLEQNFTTTDPCPDYCTLPAGHSVDSIHGDLDDPDALRSRGHGDVQFGALLAGGSEEFANQRGTFEPSVTLSINATASLDFADPLDLRLLAHHATVAAEWLEAQR